VPYGAVARPCKFRFKHKLVSLDSTVIDLCVSLFDWAHFRRTKGAIKLHLVWDHEGYLPTFAVVTTGKVADVKVAQGLTFEPGTIVVDDRGYNDYRLFTHWTAAGVWFVTRMKDNALYAVVAERPVPQHRPILNDQTICFTGVGAAAKGPVLLRRIEVWNPEKKEVLVFLTNQMKLGATTIAAIYKDRWQIELFFKALKRNLKIKTFVGTSANAVTIQVWTALIALLRLRYLQLTARFAWSLSNLVALLRMNVFTHRDLWTWLHQPFETPPVAARLHQEALGL
jgi:IS4 transposase